MRDARWRARARRSLVRTLRPARTHLAQGGWLFAALAMTAVLVAAEIYGRLPLRWIDGALALLLAAGAVWVLLNALRPSAPRHQPRIESSLRSLERAAHGSAHSIAPMRRRALPRASTAADLSRRARRLGERRRRW